MNFLLDTCVISELVKPSPNLNVIDWLSHIPSERLYLSVITIGEIRKGLTILPDSKKKEKLSNWLNRLLEDYQSRIYPIDLIVSENWGMIIGKAEKKGWKIPAVDALIAAVAYTHNLIIVTRNVSDFEKSEITVKNPWNYIEK